MVQNQSLKYVLGTERSINLHKITITIAICSKPKQFPRKIYLNEFICGKVTG